MKNLHSLITILFLTILSNGLACEICGCGNSNFQIGMLPNFKKGFLGLRYSAAEFNSTLRSDATQFSKDYIKSVELWGGYNLKKWQFMTFVPYLSTIKQSDDGTTASIGLGDAMVLVNYKIVSKTYLSKSERVTIRHEVLVGGGIKLPTGANQVNTNAADFNIGDFNSQAGTGSVDYLINLTDNFSWNRSGLITNVAYRINTANKQEYQFGNRIYLNSSYYYAFNQQGIKIMPSIGVNYQSNAFNSFASDIIEDSQGYILNSTIGINLLRRKVGFNALAFVPAAQNMYDGQTKSQGRVIVGLTYSF